MMSVALTVVSRAPNLSLMLFILIKSDCACFKTCLQTVFFLLYIDHFTSHTKFTLTKHSYSLNSCNPNFFFKNLNFSLKMAGSSSSSAINIQSGKSLVIKPNVASISKGSLRIQVENIVDFGSLERNGD